MISLTDWRSATLGAVLARQRDERGSAEAVITDTARIDYIELAARALTIARSLLAIGIGRGDHVGVLMGNDEHWLAVFYAAASIGAVTVPVNTRFKASELSFCLKQADCRALVMNERFLNIDFVQYLRDAEPAIDTALPGAALPKLANVIVIGSNISRGALSWPAFLVLGESVDDMVLSRAMQAIEPSDPLLIQFTSGTTAYPKGVLLTHDNMLRNAHAAGMRIGVRADDRYFNCRPFFHVGAGCVGVWLHFGDATHL